MKKTLLSVLLLCLISVGKLYCDQANHTFSLILEGFGSTIAEGLNIEYAPNRYFDFGLGIMPAKYSIPVEVHAYFRYDFLKTTITPFVELSSLIFLWQDGADEHFAGRIHAGILARFNSGFIIGISIGYQLIGNDFLVINNFGKFIPGAFIGWKFGLDK